MGCFTEQQCRTAGELAPICSEVAKVCETQNDIQTQIYIISGVVGGVLLILIILILFLFSRLHRSSKRADGLYNPTGDELAKRGFSTYTGPNRIPELPNTVLATPPPAPTPFVPAFATPSKPFGYDNANFDPNRSSNAMNTSGGVRVLPRNPPPGRNNNKASYNEGYN